MSSTAADGTTPRATGPDRASDAPGRADDGTHLLLIDGRHVPAQDGATFDVENPSTRETAYRVAQAGPADVDAAVSAARRAADGEWPATHPRERARVLRRAAALLLERADDIAELESLAVGRSVREMRQQVRRAPEWLEFFASAAETHEDIVTPSSGKVLNYVRHVPIGVIGQITPWNHPLLITIKKVAPAIAAGNAVVVKPSEIAPAGPLELGRVLVDAGIPAGVVNVVTGFGDTGRAIVEHPEVNRIDLTGGTETGRRVAEAAGRRLVAVQAELGGKAPVLVFDDVPAEAAVAGALFAGFVASGQTCIAGTRLLVHRDLVDEVTERLVERAAAIRVGDPFDDATQMGPVASQAQLDRVLSLVRSAREEGATVLTGGEQLTDAPYDRGWYMGPTVITGVTPEMRIMREEIFGPVITVESFDDEDHAVAIANASPFGLGAAVWTRDVQRAHVVAHRIQAGTVWINDHHRIDPASPWGGFKESGIGSENGVAALRDYMIQQSILVNLDRAAFDWFAPDARDLRYS